MKNYNFNEITNRINTNSIKFDFAIERGYKENILPFWVADMDFKVPDEVIQSLQNSVSHGIFGYTDTKKDYDDVVIDWFKKHFNYSVKSEWLVKSPGIVFAICTAIKAFTNVGESILIQKPVYYPFSLSIIENNRRLINNPLVYKDGKYEIDFIDFENKIVKNDVKLFILCSPHNPVGKVYSKKDLEKICEICLKHDVLIVSDEIHCDFTRPKVTHHLLLSINEKFNNKIVLMTAPSKTFNIAGLQVSNIFIPNEVLREKFAKEIEKTGYSQLNTLGLVAAKSAYEYGEPWLLQLKEYLEDNLSLIRSFLETNLPKIKLVEPDGTFLAWIDFSNLGLTDEKINNLIVDDANLWLDEGIMFGDEGKNFQRINYACPRNFLEKALENLYKAFANYQ